MKISVFISLLCLLPGVNVAQKVVVDSVNPLFQGKIDGEKIRERYDNFEPTFIQGKVKGRFNQVTLSIFHSNNLHTRTALNTGEQLKELAPFKMTTPSGYGFATMSDYHDYNAVPLFDSTPAIITAYGINQKNKRLYRFRVLENKTIELIPWQEVRYFSPVMIYYRYNVDGTEQRQMAYLGEFNTSVGNSITVEVKNIMLPDTVYRISAIWIKRAPQVMGVFGSDKLKELMDVYKFQWKYDNDTYSKATYYGDTKLMPVNNLLNTDSIFNADQNNLFLYLKDKVRTPEQVEYNLVKGTDSSGWLPNTFDHNIIWLQRLQPGRYTLLLRYSFQRQTVSNFRFLIQAAWYQTWLFRAVTSIISLLFIVLLFNFFKTRKQKHRLQMQTIKRQKAEMDLQFIRSQFNPHFVFNALNSIQGLIHKGRTEHAEKYLSDFSQLMRESLQSSSRQMVSLDKELQMLTHYIELEKLRFGFHYFIQVSEVINIHTTEFPTLLLQPLVENAIKHGISGMYREGRLYIDIAPMQQDMIVEIKDNGKGFDTDNDNISGYGIRLSRKRIALLSEIQPEQPVSMYISSSHDGTFITLIFKNWLI
jgi:hypothetical protein